MGKIPALKFKYSSMHSKITRIKMSNKHRQNWHHAWGKVTQDSHWCLIKMTTSCKRTAEVQDSFARPFLLPSAQPLPTNLHILANQRETKPKQLFAVVHKRLLQKPKNCQFMQIGIKTCQGVFWLFGFFFLGFCLIGWVFLTHSHKYFEF